MTDIDDLIVGAYVIGWAVFPWFLGVGVCTLMVSIAKWIWCL